MNNSFSKNTIDWTVVDEYKNEDTASGMVLALCECSKMLNYLLNNQGYKGKNIYEKIAQAKDRFSDLSGLATSLELKERIIDEYDFHPEKQTLEDGIQKFRKAINDLSETEILQMGLWERMKSWINYYFLFQKDALKKSIKWFLVLSVLIILLDNTHPGAKIVEILTKLISDIFNLVIIFLFFAILIILLITGFLYFFNKRRKKKKSQQNSSIIA